MGLGPCPGGSLLPPRAGTGSRRVLGPVLFCRVPLGSFPLRRSSVPFPPGLRTGSPQRLGHGVSVICPAGCQALSTGRSGSGVPVPAFSAPRPRYVSTGFSPALHERVFPGLVVHGTRGRCPPGGKPDPASRLSGLRLRMSGPVHSESRFRNLIQRLGLPPLS